MYTTYILLFHPVMNACCFCCKCISTDACLCLFCICACVRACVSMRACGLILLSDLAMELQALSGVVDDPVIKAKEKERTDLCALLFECNGLLGDLCCR